MFIARASVSSPARSLTMRSTLVRLQAWNILKKNNDRFFQYLSEPTKALVDVIIRALVMILFFAGTVFAVEVLGDPQWMKDEYITKDDVSISFFLVGHDSHCCQEWLCAVSSRCLRRYRNA